MRQRDPGKNAQSTRHPWPIYQILAKSTPKYANLEVPNPEHTDKQETLPTAKFTVGGGGGGGEGRNMPTLK